MTYRRLIVLAVFFATLAAVCAGSVVDALSFESWGT